MEQVTPTKPGQIVKVYMPILKEKANTDYLVAEDPSLYDDNKLLTVYAVSEILRAQAEGRKPVCDYIAKRELTVLADSLEQWVESWNK